MSLLNSSLFSPKSQESIEKLGVLAEQIADRWAGGWPGRVKTLEKNGRLLPELLSQLEREKEALAQARGSSHLAQHEIMEMYGINPEPPEL